MKIIMATGNKNKVKEIREMLIGTDIEIISMKEAGIDADIVENGTTFEENAAIKASTIARMTEKITIADDSGLSIDALGGEPGIYSARFMGEDTPYPVKCQAILEKLKDVPKDKRTARFTCAMCMATPEKHIKNKNGENVLQNNNEYTGNKTGSTFKTLVRNDEDEPDVSFKTLTKETEEKPKVEVKTFVGIMEGEIAYEIKGENGFGYDPIFMLPECGKTSAEISPEEKNAISHRGKALRLLVEELKKMVHKNKKID